MGFEPTNNLGGSEVLCQLSYMLMKKNTITVEQLREDLLKVATILNKPPSIREYRQHGTFHVVTFERRFGSWNRALEQVVGSINKKCNQPLPKHPCEGCGVITKNPKFCSASCAAKTNNVKYPKRHRQTRKCKRCGRLTADDTNSCKYCFGIDKIDSYGNRTVASLFAKAKQPQHHYSSIRLHAHRIASLNHMEMRCSVCDYNLHAQLCHRKPIHLFPKNTLLKEVNAPKNLVFLCPNHHWEIDHGHRDAVTLQPTHKLSQNHIKTGAGSQA